MTFNSLQFLIFFPIVVLLYFSLPYKWRNIFLLVASYYFYMCWRAEYLILIVASTLVDYFAGIQMERAADKKGKKKYLILSLLLNLGLLFAFKYFNFFNSSFSGVFKQFNIAYHIPNLKILLPVGISFYTFQTLSYTIDVYRGKKEAERNLLTFALYVAFFPQLVAGPIERSTRLLPQFYKNFIFDAPRVVRGMQLFLWGMFKKVVIADRLAVLVDQVYNNPTNFQGPSLVIATIFFAFQIYCDFSGYSDIAVGAAEVLGFKLMRNFNRPYFAASISEFWQRWHISLSSWFRDYLYVPLGGNRCSRFKWTINILLTFVVSGLWHGANWTFIIWGGLHGFYYLLSGLTKGIRERAVGFIRFEKAPFLHKGFQIGLTFCLVLFSWIFFRADSIQDAFAIISHLWTGWDQPLQFAISAQAAVKMTNLQVIQTMQNPGLALAQNEAINLGLEKWEFFLSCGLVVFLLMIQTLEHFFGDLRDQLKQMPLILRWGVYLGISLCIINLGVTNKIPFIYFQF